MKLALIGAGSYVFAPSFLRDAIIRHRLEGLELALVDPNLEAAEAMAALARRLAADTGVRVTVTVHAEREPALRHADAVTLCASPQGARRWAMDFDILKRHGLPCQARECGGVGGLANALRSITLALAVARDMERLCPGAMLLDVTNPMPRVVTAVNRFTRVPCAGFCNIALGGPGGYEWAGRLLGRDHRSLKVQTAGLNHFAWYTEIRDAATGADLYPLAVERLHGQPLPGEQRAFTVYRRWFAEYGLIPAGHCDHHAEYLPEQPDIEYPSAPPYHGTEEERRQRWQELAEMGAGRRPWQELVDHGSWEHPVDIAVAVHTGGHAAMPIVNTPNRGGCLPGLPEERVVEIPVEVKSGVLRGLPVKPMPAKLTTVLKAISDVHELVAAAAATGDRTAARRAIEVDPAVVNKSAALAALDDMLAAHQDMLPQFSTGSERKAL
jgi:alpha-galactosidase